jgi:hypothetical protein
VDSWSAPCVPIVRDLVPLSFEITDEVGNTFAVETGFDPYELATTATRRAWHLHRRPGRYARILSGAGTVEARPTIPWSRGMTLEHPDDD